jgi:flavin-dependent dehydrogenase
LDGKRIIGVKTFFRSYYSDLVIDSCGVFSPLKKKLKKILKLDFRLTKRDVIYTYRAGYLKKPSDFSSEKHRVYLLPNDERGISWVSDEGNKMDILIGRFFNIDKKIVNDELYFLRKCNKISNFKVSGGGYYAIPVRKPMSQIVYDGYVLIGDSAYMTIPLIGSGISLCAKAGKILADVLIKNKDNEYNIPNLWEYQARFYKEIGYDLAFKSVFKDIVYELNKDEVDFIFQNDIITDEMISTITAADELNFDINDLLSKGKKGLGNPKLMMKLGKTFVNGKIRSILCKNIPMTYDEKQVESWKEKYEK